MGKVLGVCVGVQSFCVSIQDFNCLKPEMERGPLSCFLEVLLGNVNKTRLQGTERSKQPIIPSSYWGYLQHKMGRTNSYGSCCCVVWCSRRTGTHALSEVTMLNTWKNDESWAIFCCQPRGWEPKSSRWKPKARQSLATSICFGKWYSCHRT